MLHHTIMFLFSVLTPSPTLLITSDGEINFSDFVYMVSSYCFFEPVDILKCKYSSVMHCHGAFLNGVHCAA